MTGIINRVALGYPVVSYLHTVANYAANATSTFTLGGGPGEILGFSVFKFSGVIADYTVLGIKITIDGVIIYDWQLPGILAMPLTHNEQGMFATHTIRDDAVCATSFKLIMSYESTAEIVFKNNSANQLGLGFSVPVRRGA